MPIPWKTIAPVALAVALSACGPEGEWLVERIDGRPVTGKPPTVTFEKGRVLAGAGCNGLDGFYVADREGGLAVSDLNTTLMACEGLGGERAAGLQWH